MSAIEMVCVAPHGASRVGCAFTRVYHTLTVQRIGMQLSNCLSMWLIAVFVCFQSGMWLRSSTTLHR